MFTSKQKSFIVEGKKKRSRKSVVKTLKIISKNEELIKKYMSKLSNG